MAALRERDRKHRQAMSAARRSREAAAKYLKETVAKYVNSLIRSQKKYSQIIQKLTRCNVDDSIKPVLKSFCLKCCHSDKISKMTFLMDQNLKADQHFIFSEMCWPIELNNSYVGFSTIWHDPSSIWILIMIFVVITNNEYFNTKISKVPHGFAILCNLKYS